MDTKRNHFISVSRDGRLIARRAGEPPVVVATSLEGLVVTIPEGRLAVTSIRVFFEYERCAAARDVCVREIDVTGTRMRVEDFLAGFDISDAEIGRWMRAAVEQSLDTQATGDGRRGST